jgi:hypothetical protein
MKLDFLLDKGSGAMNEDVILVAHPTFGVFDGATALVKRAQDKVTGGFAAATIAKETFQQKGDLMDLAKEANKRIWSAMVSAGVDTGFKPNLWGTTAALVRLNREYFEFFQVSDSIILLIMRDGSFRLPASPKDHDAHVLTKWKKMGTPNLPPLEALREDLLALRLRMNEDYGVMDGESEACGFFNAGKLKVQGISHILLFTDGLFIPKENPKAEHNWGEFVRVYKKGGLKGVLKQVRGMEDSDPYMLRYPRYKLHDDASAIAITL